jgi:moderate conductance mechanosensitive channel
VLLVLGALLLARFVTWAGRRITQRIDAAATDEDALVRSEAAKHRHAVAQVLTWLAIAFIWCVTGVQVLERVGVPVASLVAPAAVLGAALGFGSQQLVRDLLAGTFIILERQYGFGDLVHSSAVGFEEGATGTIEEVALRTTRLRTPNGELIIVPNGSIVQVTNLSRDWALARDLPETALHVTSPSPTTQLSIAPFTWAVVWGREVLRGVVNHRRIDGMQGVRALCIRCQRAP